MNLMPCHPEAQPKDLCTWFAPPIRSSWATGVNTPALWKTLQPAELKAKTLQSQMSGLPI
jgi:hypothetical protein